MAKLTQESTTAYEKQLNGNRTENVHEAIGEKLLANRSCMQTEIVKMKKKLFIQWQVYGM